jgi:hypothetical protein
MPAIWTPRRNSPTALARGSDSASSARRVSPMAVERRVSPMAVERRAKRAIPKDTGTRIHHRVSRDALARQGAPMSQTRRLATPKTCYHSPDDLLNGGTPRKYGATAALASLLTLFRGFLFCLSGYGASGLALCSPSFAAVFLRHGHRFTLVSLTEPVIE